MYVPTTRAVPITLVCIGIGVPTTSAMYIHNHVIQLQYLIYKKGAKQQEQQNDNNKSTKMNTTILRSIFYRTLQVVLDLAHHSD